MIHCRGDAGGHTGRLDRSSGDGKDSDQDADVAPGSLLPEQREEARVDGASEKEHPPKQSEITQASYGSNNAVHNGLLINVYDDEIVDGANEDAADPDVQEMLSQNGGNLDANTDAQHGMNLGDSGAGIANQIEESSDPVSNKKQSAGLDTLDLAPILAANRDAEATGVHRISQDVHPEGTLLRNMENDTVTVTNNEKGNPVDNLHGVAHLADHVNDGTGIALSDNVTDGFPLRNEPGKVGE